VRPTRTCTLLLGLTAGMTSMLLGSVPASAASPSADETWNLSKLGQTLCGEYDRDRPNWVFVQVTGDWTAEITFGVNGVPEDWKVLPDSPIPPGSNHDGTVQRLLRVVTPPLPPGATGTGYLWATDGTDTQTVALPIRSAERC